MTQRKRLAEKFIGHLHQRRPRTVLTDDQRHAVQDAMAALRNGGMFGYVAATEKVARDMKLVAQSVVDATFDLRVGWVARASSGAKANSDRAERSAWIRANGGPDVVTAAQLQDRFGIGMSAGKHNLAAVRREDDEANRREARTPEAWFETHCPALLRWPAPPPDEDLMDEVRRVYQGRPLLAREVLR